MGIPAFAPSFATDLLKPFYAGLAQDELRLSACAECGQIHWYPPEVMPCHPEAALIWKTVSPVGAIYSFTEVARSLLPGDHRGEVPFTVVLVASEDAPLARIPGIFIAAAGVAPACGMRVRLKRLDVGDYTLPAFEPAGD